MGLSGGQTFAIWDSNFNEIAGPFEPTGLTEGYVTQGVSCNDDFVFFVLYKDNVITVYDWDGNFITLIKLNDISSVLEEPENISIVNDEIFVGCAASEGMKVYKVEPIKG